MLLSLQGQPAISRPSPPRPLAPPADLEPHTAPPRCGAAPKVTSQRTTAPSAARAAHCSRLPCKDRARESKATKRPSAMVWSASKPATRWLPSGSGPRRLALPSHSLPVPMPEPTRTHTRAGPPAAHAERVTSSASPARQPAAPYLQRVSARGICCGWLQREISAAAASPCSLPLHRVDSARSGPVCSARARDSGRRDVLCISLGIAMSRAHD